MIRRNPRGDIPVVHESAFVDPTAILIGQVIVHENVFIGPYAVIRADEVNERGDMVVIGEHTSIAHRSIIHGPCWIGNHVFIGFNSVVYNATVQDYAVVRHNCVIDSREIPPGVYVPSCLKVNHETDTSILQPVTNHAHDFSESVARVNLDLVHGYRAIRNEF